MQTNLIPSTFNIQPHVIALINREPFFGEISRHIQKCATDTIPTAAIGYHQIYDEFMLYYNPKFFEKLSNYEIHNILVHEFYHFIFQHLTTRRKSPARLANIACDLAINSLISTNDENGQIKNKAGNPLPSFCLVPGKYPTSLVEWLIEIKDHETLALLEKHKKEMAEKAGAPIAGHQETKDDPFLPNLIAKLPALKSSEWYFHEIIRQALEELKTRGDGADLDNLFGNYDSFDDHDSWDDIPEELKEYVKGRAKSILEKGVRASDANNNWGNIPNEIREALRRYINNNVDWRVVLRQFIGNVNRGNRTSSIKRINKRYPYIHPGTRKGYCAKLLIAIDQSGSVDDKMLVEFFAELSTLTRKISVDIVHFDYEANEKEIYPWKKGQKIQIQRTRSGGTNFDAPTNIVNHPQNRGRWDGLLIMTDGECSPPGASRVKRGWVIGKGQKLNFLTNELVVQMTDNGSKVEGAIR